jgi:hypothetical protein
MSVSSLGGGSGQPGDLEWARSFGTNFHGAGLVGRTESYPSGLANETG